MRVTPLYNYCMAYKSQKLMQMIADLAQKAIVIGYIVTLLILSL